MLEYQPPMRRSLLSLAAFLIYSCLIHSCSSPIPPVPNIAVDGFDAQVRTAVLTARQRAVSEPENGAASGRLGMVLQAHSLYEPAALSYDRAIRLESREFAWRYYLAVTLQQLYQPQKALEALDGAIRIRSDYVPAVLKRGELLLQLGRFQESAAAYESALAEDPNSSQGLYGLARVRQAQADFSAAEDLYRRACQAYPSFGAAYYGLALTGRSLGHATDSAKYVELAQIYINDRPPAADPLLSQIDELGTGVYHGLEKAAELAAKGNAAEAARLNAEMLQADPENLTLLLNLLYLARLTDKLDNQIDSLYARARGIQPGLPYIYEYYGIAAARRGRYEPAAAALRKAIELRPASAEFHKTLGEVLEKQNRPAEAMEHYERAQAGAPGDRDLQIRLWFLLILHGRGKETIPQLASALAVEDSFAATRRMLLGEAYRSTGDSSRARMYLEQARDVALNQGPANLLALIDQELKTLP